MMGNNELLKRKIEFDLSIRLTIVEKDYILKNVTQITRVEDVKSRLELLCAIPKELQRLRYLDGADLMDDTTLRENDVVKRSKLQLSIWKKWERLVESIYNGNLEETKLYLNENQFDCITLHYAMFIASGKGFVKILKYLTENYDQIDINYQMSSGRSSLHVASVADQNVECIKILLNKGAMFKITDNYNQTPIHIAEEFGNKSCEKEMFMFNWETRSKLNKKSEEKSLMMYQKVDSGNPTWFKGEYSQIYMCTTPGTATSGERSASKASTKQATACTASEELPSNNDSEKMSPTRKYNKTFDEWLKDKDQQRVRELLLKKEQQLKQKQEAELKQYQKTLQRQRRQKQWQFKKKDQLDSVAKDVAVISKKIDPSTNMYTNVDYVPNFEKQLIERYFEEHE